MYITPSALLTLPADAEIVVRSHDASLYTVTFISTESTLILSENGREPMRFRNVLDIKVCLAAMAGTSAWLEHVSAYDEMVGQPVGTTNLLRVPLSLHQPY